MARPPHRGRGKWKTPGSPRRGAPPVQWLIRRPRLVTPSSAPRSESGGRASDGIQLHVLDPVAATSSRTSQCEAEVVRSEFGQSSVAGEAAAGYPSDAQQLEIRDEPSSSFSSLLRAPALTWQDTFPKIVKKENPDTICPTVPALEDLKIPEQTAAAAATEIRFKGKNTTKPLAKRQGGSRRGRPRKGQRTTEPAAMQYCSSSYARPPHPYATGKVSKVNICPVCEKYTVTELDRPADSDPSSEALRARFKCDLCKKCFDLGITLFDPRGCPGVTLYQGDDRFTPPAPPRATYPCPGCWMRADSSFQCMTVYLKEETRVPCQPACSAGRMNLNLGEPKPKKKSIQQVMGWL